MEQVEQKLIRMQSVYATKQFPFEPSLLKSQVHFQMQPVTDVDKMPGNLPCSTLILEFTITSEDSLSKEVYTVGPYKYDHYCLSHGLK